MTGTTRYYRHFKGGKYRVLAIGQDSESLTPVVIYQALYGDYKIWVRPVKIADLAKRMIALSGAKDVEIKYTGLREGEKLYEEVLNELEGTKPTFHEKIHIAQVREYDFDEVSREIDDLVETAKTFDKMETVRKMKQIVPEYKSNNSVYEVLDTIG